LDVEKLLVVALGVWAVLLVIEFWLFARKLRLQGVLMLMLNTIYPLLTFTSILSDLGYDIFTLLEMQLKDFVGYEGVIAIIVVAAAIWLLLSYEMGRIVWEGEEEGLQRVMKVTWVIVSLYGVIGGAYMILALSIIASLVIISLLISLGVAAVGDKVSKGWE